MESPQLTEQSSDPGIDMEWKSAQLTEQMSDTQVVMEGTEGENGHDDMTSSLADQVEANTEAVYSVTQNEKA